MNRQFIASPPLRVRPGSDLWKHLRRMFGSFPIIVCQVFIPFRSGPEKIDSLPEQGIEVSEEHVKQCQWMFDQAEVRRVHLEQKAQTSFGLMVFLVPLLASLFVFLVNRSTSHTTSLMLAIALVVLSAILLLLGFISIVRAISVKTIETLYLGAIIDLKNGQFRGYSRSFHARGLLYCASMNTGMNDHIAQFVKGGQILTAAALVVLLVAAIPASVMFSSVPPSAIQAKIVGPVNVVSAELIGLREDVASLRKEIAALANRMTAETGLKSLKAGVATLPTEPNRPAKKAMPVGPSK